MKRPVHIRKNFRTFPTVTYLLARPPNFLLLWSFYLLLIRSFPLYLYPAFISDRNFPLPGLTFSCDYYILSAHCTCRPANIWFTREAALMPIPVFWDMTQSRSARINLSEKLTLFLCYILKLHNSQCIYSECSNMATVSLKYWE